jgi:predicted nucleotidyltransferase
MKRKVLIQQLRKLELKHSIKIIHAAESGSRQWGFESKDSDYDIRFIYRRHPRHVVSPFSFRDVIEHREVYSGDILDIVGWDLSKTIVLMLKGNAQPHEWLSYPPLITIEDEAALLRSIEFSWEHLHNHYCGIATNNWTRYIHGRDFVRTKRYLYVIRGIANAQYVLRQKRVPPRSLPQTIALLKATPAFPEQEAFCDAAKILLHKKRQSELGVGKRITEIDGMLSLLVNRNPAPAKPDVSNLNVIYQKLIFGEEL